MNQFSFFVTIIKTEVDLQKMRKRIKLGLELTRASDKRGHQ
jgi:hypothetical protein